MQIKSLVVVVALVLVCCTCTQPAPVAKVHITDGLWYKLKSLLSSERHLDVSFCGKVYDSDKTLVVYSVLNRETWERDVRVAMGKMDEISSAAVLYPVPVVAIATKGSPNDLFTFNITIKYFGVPHTLFLSSAQRFFGTELALKEIPAEVVKSVVPAKAYPGFYGTLPGGDTFLIYSVPRAQEEPEDWIEGMLRRIYPPMSEMHVLVGPSARRLEEVKSHTRSFFSGREIYIETKRGVFFFPTPSSKPFFGQYVWQYLPAR